MKLIYTESSSVYELHDGPEHRREGQLGVIVRCSQVGGFTNGERVEHLRKDGEPIPVLAMSRPVVGLPWHLVLQIRDDGVVTERITTPVARLVGFG